MQTSRSCKCGRTFDSNESLIEHPCYRSFRECQLCSKLATIRCSECKATQYCSGDCQDKDKEAHAQICKDDTVLLSKYRNIWAMQVVLATLNSMKYNNKAVIMLKDLTKNISNIFELIDNIRYVWTTWSWQQAFENPYTVRMAYTDAEAKRSIECTVSHIPFRIPRNLIAPLMIEYEDSCVLCLKKGSAHCTKCLTCYCSIECQKLHWSIHKYVCSLGNVRKGGILHNSNRMNIPIHELAIIPSLKQYCLSNNILLEFMKLLDKIKTVGSNFRIITVSLRSIDFKKPFEKASIRLFTNHSQLKEFAALETNVFAEHTIIFIAQGEHYVYTF